MKLPHPNDPTQVRDATVVRNDLHRTIRSGVTVAFIARTSGLNPTTLSRINSGKAKTVNLATFGRLLDTLDRIDRGTIVVPPSGRRDPGLPAVQAKGADVCLRGHNRTLHTRVKADGTRQCTKCQQWWTYQSNLRKRRAS